ncbi:hypothetical protein F511_32750 [Dorcoceras hygrometricum]|uniref:Pectinesterase inhibitor domain-containing protein n=1 Tax=Dorcoceras hygrometricum TaxID=472368 RepID=A0A2Z7BMM4_9LAMI|nr:hypothetical protein F511_32750 [Dorcoceras hygrometricum]
MCQVSVTQTLVYGTNTQIFVTKAKDNAGDNSTRDLYMICELRYDALLDAFEDASFAFAKRDYKSMLYQEGKCSRFVYDCQRVIGYSVPELSNMSSQMRVLISMSLITTTMLSQS